MWVEHQNETNDKRRFDWKQMPRKRLPLQLYTDGRINFLRKSSTIGAAIVHWKMKFEERMTKCQASRCKRALPWTVQRIDRCHCWRNNRDSVFLFVREGCCAGVRAVEFREMALWVSVLHWHFLVHYLKRKCGFVTKGAYSASAAVL